MPIGTKNVSSDKLSEIEISNIGKILRRTNADELPQLINILMVKWYSWSKTLLIWSKRTYKIKNRK